VKGHVRFHGTPPADVPRPSKLAFPECSSFGPPDSTLKLGTDGAVAEAFVWIESGLPDAGWPAPTVPVVLDQERCEFKPRVFGVQVGQPVEIRNSDAFLHNTHAFEGGFNVPLPTQGAKVTKTFPHESVPAVIGCDVHGWMRAYAGVVTNPFYAVTDANGAFDISGLPAGHYTLGIWQERLGRRGKQVDVAEGGETTAEVELKN
jgi:plastocyanin